MEMVFKIVIFLSIVITVVIEVIYQLTYKSNPIILSSLQDLTFAVLGFLASVASLMLYKVFSKTKEISTINFILAPKKFKEEIKFLSNLLLFVFIGWTFYFVMFVIYNSYLELRKYEMVFSVLYDSYLISSLLLSMGVITTFYRWRRRISSYA